MSRHPISGWRNYTFSEIAKKEKFAIVDGPFGTQLHSDEYTENGVPVVRIENLSFSGKFKPDNLVFISEKKAEQLKRSRVVPGDLIIAKTGATIGKSGMFPDAFNSGIIASSCMKVSCDTNIVDPKLILYMIVWEEGQKKILEGAGGSTRTSINIGPFSNIQLYLPESKSEQHKIAEILTTVDDAIEQTEALIQKYQRIKQGLMQDLLTRGVDENGSLRPSPELAPHLYIKTPQGWLPKEWEISSIKDVCNLITSGSRGWARYYSEDGALFIRIGNLSRENINLRLESIQRVNAPKNSEGKRTAVTEGDILISITADLGVIGVIPPDFEEAYCNQHIALVRVDSSRTNPRWLGHYLASLNGQKQFILLNDSGAKAGLNLPTVGSIKFANPPQEERDTIVRILDQQDKMIEVEINHRNKLEQLKTGLMQDLLTGKVRVTGMLDN